MALGEAPTPYPRRRNQQNAHRRLAMTPPHPHDGAEYMLIFSASINKSSAMVGTDRTAKLEEEPNVS